MLRSSLLLEPATGGGGGRPDFPFFFFIQVVEPSTRGWCGSSSELSTPQRERRDVYDSGPPNSSSWLCNRLATESSVSCESFNEGIWSTGMAMRKLREGPP